MHMLTGVNANTTREDAMGSKTFSIPNISCGHCTNAIQEELADVAGVSEVTGDIAARTVTVTWDSPADEAAIRNKLTEINYPAAD